MTKLYKDSEVQIVHKIECTPDDLMRFADRLKNAYADAKEGQAVHMMAAPGILFECLPENDISKRLSFETSQARAERVL